MPLRKITPSELNAWKSDRFSFELVDVREAYEFEERNIGGKNIPMAEVLDRKNELPTEKAVLFCCKTGKRSAAIAHTLERKYGLSNLYSLEGGIELALAHDLNLK
jgi:rhodanese-related sulfurtransferase